LPEEPPPPEINLADIDTAPPTAERSPSDATVTERALLSEFARVTEENSQLKQDLEALQKKARTAEILDDLIEPYAAKAYWFMCAYSGVIGLMLLMNAFGCFRNPISSDVLQVLVGSTAVTVIGLVGMVLTGIFVGARK
jgi:hypothetical protein